MIRCDFVCIGMEKWVPQWFSETLMASLLIQIVTSSTSWAMLAIWNLSQSCESVFSARAMESTKPAFHRLLAVGCGLPLFSNKDDWHAKVAENVDTTTFWHRRGKWQRRAACRSCFSRPILSLTYSFDLSFSDNRWYRRFTTKLSTASERWFSRQDFVCKN